MRTCSTPETCGVAGAGAMGIADAGDAANAPNVAPNRPAATRPILKVMMSSSAYARQDIEVVLLKLWRSRNVMLTNRPSVTSHLRRALAAFIPVPQTDQMLVVTKLSISAKTASSSFRNRVSPTMRRRTCARSSTAKPGRIVRLRVYEIEKQLRSGAGK
jgi:hypothetical protein